jgi:hypothetical protein
MAGTLRETDDLHLIARLREHVAGDENLERLLNEIEIRMLRHVAFASRAASVLLRVAELQAEAEKTAELVTAAGDG